MLNQLLNATATLCDTTAQAANNATITLASTTSDTTAVDTLLYSIGHNIVPVLVFGVGGLIAVSAIVFGTHAATTQAKERERTKRELAAYVAEGSITPDDAERLLSDKQRKC